MLNDLEREAAVSEFIHRATARKGKNRKFDQKTYLKCIKEFSGKTVFELRVGPQLIHSFYLDCLLIQVIKNLVKLSFFAAFLLISYFFSFTRLFCKKHRSSSEEVGLAHDTHELLLRDLTVSISVSLLDHLIDLIISHVLTKLLGNTLQISE